MTINLADNDPRIEYTVADGNSQQVFTVPFEFFDDGDLNVYQDGTLKTLTTHYLTADNNDANSRVAHTSGTTGFIHFTTGNVPTASGADIKIVITRSIDIERTTDFPSSGPFDVGSLNTALDKVIAIQADLKDDIDRSLRLTDFDLDATLTLPAVDTRKGKTLAFNATTGAVEAGPSIGDVQTVSAASADIATLADIEDGTDATDAIQTVAGISGNVTTVAGISSNVSTVAGQTTNLQNVTDNLTAIQNAAQNATDAASAKTAAETAQAAAEAALDTFDDRFLGAKSSEPNQDNDGNALLDGALFFDTTVNLMKVYDQSGSQWVQLALTGTNQTNVNTVAGQISPTNNISTVAGAIDDGTFANATTFAGIYSVGSSDPTSPTPDAGDLFYNTTSNTLKVYNGSGWVDATLQGATITSFEYTATAGQTAFTGNDNNGVSLNYNTANLLVTINGVIIPSSDYTTTSATTLTLDADAAAEVGDSVVIISYSEFSASAIDIVVDTTPQLGGNLDVNGNSIVSTSDGDINITPNGTGKVKIDDLSIDGSTIAAETTNTDLVLQPNGAGDVEVNLQALGSVFNLNMDNDGSSKGPVMNFKRTSSSPADNDELGSIVFYGNDTFNNLHSYAAIVAVAEDVTNGSEDGKLIINVAGGDSAHLFANPEIEISAGAVAFPNKEYFHVDLTTLQASLADNSTVTVDFGGSGTVKYDTHSKFDSATDSYLLDSGDGVYLISFSVAISSDAVSTETLIDHAVQVQVATDGTNFTSIQGGGGHLQDNAGAEYGSTVSSGTFIYKATTTSTKVRVQAYANTVGGPNWEIPVDVNSLQAGTITGGNDARCTFLSIARIA